MGLRIMVKKLVERITDTHIYRVLPRGIDFVQDIAISLPTYRVDIIFDIGANVGQSSKLFLTSFPSSHIYCFELVSDTFRQLQDNLEGNERVDCYQLAFGSYQGTARMVLQGSSDMFFVSGQSKEAPNNDVPTEAVDMVTLDDFCHTKRIDCISYLKIDTEGGDLDVLRGAVSMLTEQRIDLAQLETGMNRTNRRHMSLESLKAFLESHGYFLFGIYEQVNEWPTSEPHLRRANSIFISQRLIERHKMSARCSA